MDNYYSSESLDGEDSFGNRYGCLILIIATVLFAIQRFLIFSFLGNLSSQANSTASAILDFLFGEPPYSVFDLLLGFEMPDDALFYLLQPRNWALGLVQAIHWGLNIGLAMLPFWLFSQTKKSAGMRKWLGYSGCLALVLVLLVSIFSVWPRLSEPVLESLQSQTSSAPAQDDAEAYSFRGLAHYDKGDLDRSIADYDKAIQLKPDFAEAYSFRGVAHYDKGDLDHAIADYDKAIQLKPDLAAVYFFRGNAYYDKGDLNRAMADYDKAIQLKPDYAEAYIRRGTAYLDKDDLDRAIADFDKAMQLKPDYAEAHFSRGTAYVGKDEYDLAMADYDKAIQLKPDFAEAYFFRGVAYFDIGDLDRAMADFDKAIQLKPDYAWSYSFRGVTYKLKGEKERAIADFKKVLELSNDPYWRQQAEEHLKALGAR